MVDGHIIVTGIARNRDLLVEYILLRIYRDTQGPDSRNKQAMR